MKQHERGFSLIELMVAIGILAALLGIVLIAINPGRQFASANNTRRRSDVNVILNAVGQYVTDHHGNLPSGVPVCATTTCTGAAYKIDSTNVDICSGILTGGYIASLPVDPLTNGGSALTTCTGPYVTNYEIYQSSTNNWVTVQAPAAEGGETISVTR